MSVENKRDAAKRAIAAHGQWKVKFRDFMGNKIDLNPQVVCADNQCEFGKWLHQHGKQQLDASEYQEIQKLHAAFHQAARNVVLLKKAGNLTDAEKSLQSGGDFASASANLTIRLMKVA